MIELDKNYNSNPDIIIIGQDLLDFLPRPISELISQLETEDDPQLRLQSLCLSLIPMTFQYFALILSSEYLFSEDPQYVEVMNNRTEFWRETYSITKKQHSYCDSL